MTTIPFVPKVLFNEFQLMHYEQRLAEAKTLKEKKFLERELKNLTIAITHSNKN